MQKQPSPRRKPKIIVTDRDHERLVSLAAAALERAPEVAEELLAEMDRAKVVSLRAAPENVVRMGSRVEYETNDGKRRSVELVYPAEADIAEGKVSIMTPIGTALIGLSPGQSIAWTARDGREHQLTVVGVAPPAPDAAVAASK